MAAIDLSDPDALRKHFHSLTAKSDKVREKLDPLRAELDGHVAGEGQAAKLTIVQHREHEAKLRADIVKLQRQLAPIENERAVVARALGGKTGQP